MKKLLAFLLLFLVAAVAQADDIVGERSGYVYACGGWKPVLRAVISGASTDNTIVSAVTGKKLRVLEFALVVTSATTVAFESGTGGTALTGDMPFAANGGVMASFTPHGHFETAAGALLNMELGGTVQTSGWLSYIQC